MYMDIYIACYSSCCSLTADDVRTDMEVGNYIITLNHYIIICNDHNEHKVVALVSVFSPQPDQSCRAVLCEDAREEWCYVRCSDPGSGEGKTQLMERPWFPCWRD